MPSNFALKIRNFYYYNLAVLLPDTLYSQHLDRTFFLDGCLLFKTTFVKTVFFTVYGQSLWSSTSVVTW